MTSPNADQIKHWNEVVGPVWLAHIEEVCAQIRPFGQRALDHVQVRPGDRVLDIGCGTGETTLELARRAGPGGEALGVDISAPLLDHARKTASAAGIDNVRFLQADAQTEALPEAAFDHLFSRFGVMFFGDPLAAFTNLRRALRPGAALTFVCWRSAAENAWISLPLAAVARVVSVPPPVPNAPGPLAFASQERVRSILEGAGFVDVAHAPIDLPTRVGGGRTLEDAVGFLMEMGPAASVMRGADPAARPACMDSIREAVAPYFGPDGLTLAGAAWLVTAQNP